MFTVQVTSAAMKLLPVACLCLVTRCGLTSADQNGPTVVKVEQDRDVILPCSLSKENIELKLFDWKKAAEKDEKQKEVFFYDAGVHYNSGRSGQSEQFKGRVSHFPEELKHGNASITIRNTKMTDSGEYTCVFPRLQPRQTFHIKLVVGAAVKPYIKIRNQTNDWALLQCEVLGASPKPKVEWQDASGEKLPANEPQITERGDGYDIILQTTVTKTDFYYCVATQEEINHQVSAETFVRITGAAPEPSVTITEAKKDWSRLQCIVRGASPKPTVEWKNRAGNVIPAEETKITETGGSFDIVIRTTVYESDYYRCVVTQDEIDHQTEADIYVYIGGFDTGLVVGIFVALLVGVGVGAFLAQKCKCPIPPKCNEDEKRRSLGDSSRSEQLQPPQTSPEV